jgi:hypothetical protein
VVEVLLLFVVVFVLFLTVAFVVGAVWDYYDYGRGYIGWSVLPAPVQRMWKWRHPDRHVVEFRERTKGYDQRVVAFEKRTKGYDQRVVEYRGREKGYDQRKALRSRSGSEDA